MYTTAKGYIVPVLLVVVLLVMAGYFVLAWKPAEKVEQLADTDTTVQATTTMRTPGVPADVSDSATSTDDTDAVGEDESPSATSTGSTTLDIGAGLE